MSIVRTDYTINPNGVISFASPIDTRKIRTVYDLSSQVVRYDLPKLKLGITQLSATEIILRNKEGLRTANTLRIEYDEDSGGDGAVTSVNSQTGDVVLTKTDIGLGNADNTSDANKPISTATQTALNNKADLVGGFIPTSQIPAVAITEFLGSVANQTAMLALVGQRGDWCIRTDNNQVYVLIADAPSLIGSWQVWQYPISPVTSVNGQVGIVVLSKIDIGLGNVPNLDTSITTNITDTALKRFVTDTEKTTWNSKEPAITSGLANQYWNGTKAFSQVSYAQLSDTPDVLVTSLANLPAPVSGVITLANNTTYRFKGIVNIGTNQIALGESCTIYGVDRSDDGITYTGSASMFTGTNKVVSIRTLRLDSGASGSIFSITNSVSQSIEVLSCLFFGLSMGTITGANLLILEQNMSVTNGNLNLTGTFNLISINCNYFESSKSHVLLNTVTANNIIINGNYVRVGATFVGFSFTAVTSEDLTREFGAITGNGFYGSGTYLQGISSSSVNYIIKGNNGVKDTEKLAEIRMSANATATPIASTANYYKALGVTSALLLSQFDMPADNRLRYIGVKPITLAVKVVGSHSVTSNGRTSRVALFFFDISASTGAILTNSEQEVRLVTGNESNNFSIIHNITFDTNDYIEVHFRNLSNTDSLTMEFMNIVI